MSTRKDGKVLIVGGGLAGLLGGCMLAKKGYEVHIFGVDGIPFVPSRTVALLEKSVAWLVELGVWERVRHQSHGLNQMVIQDGGCAKGEVSFFSAEAGKSCWAEHLKLQDLKVGVLEVLREEGAYLHEGRVSRVGGDSKGVWLEGEDQDRVCGDVLLGADGRGSVVRKQAGIALRHQGEGIYILTGLLTYRNEDVAKRYRGQTLERYGNKGLQTLVPMVGDKAALLWLGSFDTMKRLDGLSEEVIVHLLHQTMGFDEEVYRDLEREKIFKLDLFCARNLSRGRMILLGEAAHGFPPVAAQGLNLTIRGVRAMQDCLQDGVSLQDLGFCYQQKHHEEVWQTCGKVAMLTRLLLLSSGSVSGLARGAMISALGRSQTLRSFAVRAFEGK